jgi:hypothetical protein
MCPIERWRAAGPLSEEAQDHLDRIVIGADDEPDQWATFAQTLSPEQRRAFEVLREHVAGPRTALTLVVGRSFP